MQEYWNYKYRNVKSGFGVHDIDHLKLDHYPNASIVHSYSEFHRNQTRLMIDAESLTPLQLRWNSYLSIANMAPKVGILIINVYHGHKVPVRPKFLISLVVIALCFIVTGVMTKINTDGFQNGFLSLTLVTVVFITCFSGILQVMFKSTLIYLLHYL